MSEWRRRVHVHLFKHFSILYTLPAPSGQYWIDPVNGDLYIPVLKECHAGVYHGVVSVGKNRLIYSNPATIMVLSRYIEGPGYNNFNWNLFL